MKKGMVAACIVLALASCSDVLEINARAEIASAYPSSSPYPDSRFVLLHDARIHYRVWNVPQEKRLGRVLLIHGFTGSTYSWNRLAPLLTNAGFAVAAADLPAFGFSDRAQGLDHSQSNRAEWMNALLEVLETEIHAASGSGWDVAGHSMGGGTAAALSQLHPGKVRRLVLIDPALQVQEPNFWLTLPPVRGFGQWYAEGSLFQYRAISNLLASAYSAVPRREDVLGYLAPLLIRDTARAILDTAGAIQAKGIPDPSALHLPVLALWGSLDAWISPTNAEWVTNRIVLSRLLLINGAGHCPMETHPEETAVAITAFLREEAPLTPSR